MLADTSFIIDLMDKDEGALQKMQLLTSKCEPLILTTITIFELFSGITQSKKPIDEKRKVLEVTTNQIILPFDTASAEKAGEIDGSLIAAGKMMDEADSMIAGIALLNGETVLTRNVKDFERISGLKIETY